MRRQVALAVRVALVAALVVFFLLVLVAPTDDEAAIVERPDVEHCLAAAVAAERVAAGVGPLAIDGRLTAGARAHAAAMAASSTLRHSSTQTAYPGPWAAVAENVATHTDAASCAPMAVRLAASPTHHANAVDPAWQVVGVGAVESEGVLWAAVAFAMPATQAAAPAPTTAPPLPTVLTTRPATTTTACAP